MLKLVCTSCGHTFLREFESQVDVSNNPELKAEIVSGRYFRWECEKCGKVNLIKYPFIYKDSNLIIVLSDANLKAEEELPGITTRLVRQVGDLIEKIKIYNNGLDDVVMEVCKYVIRQEMNQDVNLRFMNIDGADGNMVFGFGAGEDMKILEVGFNVYEDCAGIVNRNPSIKNAAKGLICIDREWIENFFI